MFILKLQGSSHRHGHNRQGCLLLLVSAHLSFIDVAVPHAANGQFGAVRHCEHVHIQYGAPLFHISVQQRASEGNAGIVDADVDAAKLFTDAVEERLDLFRLVQVAVEGHQGAGLVRQLRRELLWDIRSQDRTEPLQHHRTLEKVIIFVLHVFR